MQKGSQSPFLAYLLIGLGVVFLCATFTNFWSLVFPALLIGGGAYLLFGRDITTRTRDVKTDRFSAPVDKATSARVDLALSVGEARVRALTDAANLVDADLTYIGDIDFSVSGDIEKAVRLQQTSHSFINWIDPVNWFGGADKLEWTVGLSPHVPMHLSIQCGMGTSYLDLRDLQISDMRVGCGAGHVKLTLPAVSAGYTAQLTGGAGDFKIALPDGATLGTHLQCGLGGVEVKIGTGAALNAQIQGGAGQVKIELPPGAALRLQAKTGVGHISVPPHFVHIASDDHVVGQSGTWETPGFAEAARQSTITFNGGVGDFTVRQGKND